MLHYSLFTSINYKAKFTSSLLNIYFFNIQSEETSLLNLHPKSDIKIYMALDYVLAANSILWQEITSFLCEKSQNVLVLHQDSNNHQKFITETPQI